MPRLSLTLTNFNKTATTKKKESISFSDLLLCKNDQLNDAKCQHVSFVNKNSMKFDTSISSFFVPVCVCVCNANLLDDHSYPNLLFVSSVSLKSPDFQFKMQLQINKLQSKQSKNGSLFYFDFGKK